jgi:hypothetical protein
MLKASFPRIASELSLDWFNAATAGQVGAPASDISVEPLDGGDGFYGSLHKVTASYANAEKPRAFVAKLSTQDPLASAAVNQINCYEREVNFYRHVADRIPVRVPECYFAEYDQARGESLLLLELIDGTPGTHLEGATFEQAEAAMRIAARLHGAWQGNPALAEPWIDKLTDARFTGAMAEAAGQAIPLALQKLPGIAPKWIMEQVPRADEMIVEQARALNECPHTLIHFDYHASNLMFPSKPSSEGPALIDWQFVVSGPGVWDVGAFCVMGLPVEQRRAWELELGLIYLSELSGEAVAAWPRWFREAYPRFAVSFAAHMIRNTPVFDFDDPNVVAIVRELMLRADRAIEDHDARHLAG